MGVSLRRALTVPGLSIRPGTCRSSGGYSKVNHQLKSKSLFNGEVLAASYIASRQVLHKGSHVLEKSY